MQPPAFVQLSGGILWGEILPLGHQAAGKHIGFLPDGEGKGHLSGHPVIRLVAPPLLQIVPPEFIFAVIAAAAAVEGEGHGIKNGGFAAAGGAFDQEHPAACQLLKIHNLLLYIGAKGLHFQSQWFHSASASSTAWANSCKKWSVASCPISSRQKDLNTSAGSDSICSSCSMVRVMVVSSPS